MFAYIKWHLIYFSIHQVYSETLVSWSNIGVTRKNCLRLIFMIKISEMTQCWTSGTFATVGHTV